MDRDDPAYKGQRDYTRLLLNAYDPLVLGPIAKFVWHCPTTRLLERYRQRIRSHHLDVGPGTGYFLERSGLPDGSPVTILDPNPNVLRHVSRRLGQLDITAVEADVLKPLPVSGPFESAALHLVIHCLPGPLTQGDGRRQRGHGPCAGWRALRCIGRRELRAPHVVGTEVSCHLQLAGWLRQPR